MKNILYLLALVCFVLTACQKEEEFDFIETTTTEEPPQEIDPEISFRAVDKNGVPLADVKLQVYEEGTQKLELLTDESGTVTAKIPSGMLEERLLLLGEKAVYNDNILRIEPGQIELGLVEIVLTPIEESAPVSESNVSPLLSSEVVLVDGRITDTDGNPGGFIVFIFEEEALSNNDSTLFQNYVFVDQNGFYEMLVPTDVDLVLSILEADPCSAEEFRTINAEDISFSEGIFGEQIGSFSEDTTLPTNTNAGQIDGQSIDLTFNGTVMGCDGLPVPNAVVSFYTIDIMGGSLIGSGTTNSEGVFSKTLNIGCVGYPGFVVVINAPNTPQFSYSTNYVEGENTVEFSELQVCGQGTFTGRNHTNSGDITHNNLVLDAYEPGVSVTITEDPNATDRFLFAGQMMSNGFWTGTAFEIEQNGTPLYRKTEDFVFSLIDDGDRIRVNMIGIEVDILSGPDAGTVGALFNCTSTVFK